MERSLLRMKQFCTALCVGLALCLLPGCSALGRLVTMQIEVKSSRQSLREQILGTYDEVGDEVFLLAGVRSVDPMTGKPKAPPRMTESERRALDARRSIEFNRDDVLRFKRLGYMGEGRDGSLVVFQETVDKLNGEDPWLLRLVMEITAEENRDRERVARRIQETTPELQGESGLQMVREVLAEKYRSEAEPGMKVQMSDGSWVTKGGEETSG